MSFTPLGYIPLGFINATIIHIPVILGAIFCGPKHGAFLGFLFGFTSFLKNTFMPATASAFVFSPILAGNLFGIKGVLLSSFICFLPRILVGILPYCIYLFLRKMIKNKTLVFTLVGIAGSLTLFLSWDLFSFSIKMPMPLRLILVLLLSQMLSEEL